MLLLGIEEARIGKHFLKKEKKSFRNIYFRLNLLRRRIFSFSSKKKKNKKQRHEFFLVGILNKI